VKEKNLWYYRIQKEKAEVTARKKGVCRVRERMHVFCHQFLSRSFSRNPRLLLPTRSKRGFFKNTYEYLSSNGSGLWLVWINQ